MTLENKIKDFKYWFFGVLMRIRKSCRIGKKKSIILREKGRFIEIRLKIF